MRALDTDTTVFDVLRPDADDLAATRQRLQRELHDKPLLGTERPMSAVLLDLVIAPGVMALALGQLDASEYPRSDRPCASSAQRLASAREWS